MKGKKLTQQEYIEQCKKANPEYDYSEIGFTTISGQFVTPICKKHGKFKVNAAGLRSRHMECPECKRENRFNSFILKAKKLHREKYQYDLSTYKNNKTPIRIICPIHGEFWQAICDHLKGYGCSKCSRKYKPTTEEWIKKAAPVYNYKYDYSKVEYVDNKTPVTVVCSEHGEFYPIPGNHLKGVSGCPKCAAIKRHNTYSKTTELFIKDAIRIHGNRYDYSKVEYYNKSTPVTIICKEHGSFTQIPSSHLSRSGCPACSFKNQGILYSKIRESFSNLLFKQEYTSEWLGKQRLDIYCPEYNFAIEYDGEQHFSPIDYFGGDKHFLTILNRDLEKNKKCVDHRCKLFRVMFGYTEEDYEELVANITSYLRDSIAYIPKLRDGSKVTVI